MNTKNYTLLSTMMFLQFFIWGAWFVTLGTYLSSTGFSGTEIGSAFLMNNIGAIISPFFIGLIADRFFAAEKIMGVLHIAGGLVLYYVSDLTTAGSIIFGLLIYNVCYMPTLALANTISFNQMTSPDTQFPKVRIWGTIGWIVAGLVISYGLAASYNNIETTAIPMKMAAIASLVMGLFSFALPKTPAQNTGKKTTIGDILGLDALALMKDRSFAIFALCSLLISIPLAFYYAFANLYFNELGMENVAGTMTLGQMSEAGFMALMPFFFRRLGVKWMLLVGMLAWAVRYALFAAGDMQTGAWMLYAGIVLHGICYDFFFVTGQIYVDRKADKSIRASAQGFISLITYGVGLAIGSSLSGIVVDYFTQDGVKDWIGIWMTPCLFAIVVAMLFALTFNDKEDVADEALQPTTP
ncbi:ProP protein [marine gamma proteobacterium HTCC2143]|jgi:nucleoside transporter|uniref:ProP protein n=1 Tax=marine gamma proteobacterium HTCC2143 TaxID=247633 RepID=A0YAG9_9GAMM|nr:ProP protein [marine gamma proteobacterium HTCC2143]